MEALTHLLRQFEPSCAAESALRQQLLQDIENRAEALLSRAVTPHLTASLWVMDRTCQEVLMVHHNIYNSWSWTGGHADGDADLLAVAVREAEEESGVRQLQLPTAQLLALELLPVIAHTRRGEPVPAHHHYCAVFAAFAEPTLPLTHRPDENSAARWLPADALADFVTESAMLPLYDKLTARMRQRYLSPAPLGEQ
ncbi:MAG: NUDIX hydrolase [Firmicutes bacterium]|nr:NUDIX hydrolase [Bacillota bacterium]